VLYVSSSFVPTFPVEEADICFIGIPFDSTASAVGNQRFGPLHVRQALRNIHWNVPGRGNPLKRLKICDLGDVEVVPESLEETSERVKDTIESVKRINSDIFFLFIGGDHSITLPIIRTLKPKSVVHLDAHADMWGSNLSHSSWAMYAKKEGFDLHQFGVRAFSEKEKPLKGNLKKLKEPVYVTVDMDVFDPSFAPDAGLLEPNGLAPQDVFGILDKVFRKRVIGMDIVEISSLQLNNPTAQLAARLILHVLSNLNG